MACWMAFMDTPHVLPLCQEGLEPGVCSEMGRWVRVASGRSRGRGKGRGRERSGDPEVKRAHFLPEVGSEPGTICGLDAERGGMLPKEDCHVETHSDSTDGSDARPLPNSDSRPCAAHKPTWPCNGRVCTKKGNASLLVSRDATGRPNSRSYGAPIIVPFLARGPYIARDTS